MNHSLKLHVSDVPSIMIGSITVGTNNLSKALAFYGDMFAEMAAGPFIELLTAGSIRREGCLI